MSRGELTVQVPGFTKLRDASIGGSLELSVEVFNEKMGLVEQTRAGSSISLDEGKYVVAVTRPDGARSTQVVHVQAEDETTVTLDWSVPPGPRAVEKGESRGYTKSAMGAAPDRFWIRYVTIDPHGTTRPMSTPPSAEVLEADATPRRLAVSVGLQVMGGEEKVRFAQIRVPELGQLAVALPLSPSYQADQCRLDLSITAAAIEIDVRFTKSLEADYLAQLLEAHQVEEAASFEVLKSLLQGKMSDPIGAALSAYALLRRGEIDDQLGIWIDNLAGFDWLPDGMVVQAALRMARGERLGALESVGNALGVGLPLFTDGLSILDQILRGLVRKHHDAVPHLESLATVLPYIDFSEVSTTLRHRDSDLDALEQDEGWRRFRIPHVLTNQSDYWG